MYLDHDEDHIGDNEKMSMVIHARNTQKIRYLQDENNRLKQQLDDANDNILINKNMIKIVLDNQEGSQKDKQK